MAGDLDGEPRSFLKGKASLMIAIAVVVVVMIDFPAYRLFFAISVGIGVLFAGVIYLWHKYRPLKEEDINNKRPLGLS
jgi:hypothetical protein